MAKFKIGDIVRVKDGLEGGRYYNNVYFNCVMKRFCGKVYVINDYRISSDVGEYELGEINGVHYYDDNDVALWIFSDDMLERYNHPFARFLEDIKHEI